MKTSNEIFYMPFQIQVFEIGHIFTLTAQLSLDGSHFRASGAIRGWRLLYWKHSSSSRMGCVCQISLHQRFQAVFWSPQVFFFRREGETQRVGLWPPTFCFSPCSLRHFSGLCTGRLIKICFEKRVLLLKKRKKSETLWFISKSLAWGNSPRMFVLGSLCTFK